jgi:hypothetical protein
MKDVKKANPEMKRKYSGRHHDPKAARILETLKQMECCRTVKPAFRVSGRKKVTSRTLITRIP